MENVLDKAGEIFKFFDVTIAVAIRGRSGESRFLSFTIYRERIGEEEEESIRSFEF